MFCITAPPSSGLWEDAPAREKGGPLQPAPYGCSLNVPEGTREDDRCFNASGEEELTSQKHAGEVVIRFSAPFCTGPIKGNPSPASLWGGRRRRWRA